MVDLTQIDLTDGIPTGGTGQVKTINALMADGGQETIGFKADAKNIDPDSAGTVTALLKGILQTMLDVKARLPTALGAEGGLKVDSDGGTPLPVSVAVVPTHDVYVLQKGFVSIASFTCGTTAYAAGDVVGAGGGAAKLTFSGIASGAAVISVDVASLEIDTGALISGETNYRLHLYSATPPSNYNDSVPWDIPAGDRSAYMGFIDFTGTFTAPGSTLFMRVLPATLFKTAGGTIYGYLVSNGPYTPTARVFKVTLYVREIG